LNEAMVAGIKLSLSLTGNLFRMTDA